MAVKSLQVPTLVCHSSVPGGACLLIFLFSCGMAAVLDGSYPRRHFEQLIAGRFDRARSFRNVLSILWIELYFFLFAKCLILLSLLFPFRLHIFAAYFACSFSWKSLS